MHDPTGFDAKASCRAIEEGVRQIERLIEEGNLVQAELAFELTASGVAVDANEDQLARLHRAAEVIGIQPEANSLPPVPGAPRF